MASDLPELWKAGGTFLRFLRLLPLVLFLLTTPSCIKRPPPVTRIATSVTIIPSDLHVSAGSKVELRAVILDDRDQGLVTTGNVTWSGRGPGGQTLSFSPNPGNPTVLTVPTPTAWGGNQALGLTDVRATFTAENMSGEIRSRPAKIHVSYVEPSGGNPSQRDRLDLPHLQGGPPTLVLLDASLGDDCLWGTPMAVAGRAYFPSKLGPRCGSGSGPGFDLTVFPPQGAVRLMSPASSLSQQSITPFSPYGVTSQDQGYLSAPTSSRARVEVRLWNGTGEGIAEVDYRILSDLERAKAIFRRSWAGIDLVAEGGGVIKDIHEPGSSTLKAITFDPTQCEKTTYYNEIFPAGAFSDVNSHKVIHVLYVKEMDFGSGSGSRTWDTLATGKACLWTSSTGAPVPALAVLSLKASSWGTLTHELGHLLGLNSNTMAFSGHPDLKRDGFFACWNVMWDNVTGECGGNRDRFSLGQVFRMHVDPKYAWIPHLGLYQGKVRTCQWDPLGTSPCPAASVDVWKRGGG